MIPLKLTPERYAEHFPPSPDYVLIQRVYDSKKNEKVNSLYMPRKVVDSTARFVGVGKVLALSRYEPFDPEIQHIYNIVKELKYVAFSYHTPTEPVMMNEFILQEGTEVLMIHLKDTTQLPHNLDILIKEQEENEASLERGSSLVS